MAYSSYEIVDNKHEIMQFHNELLILNNVYHQPTRYTPITLISHVL